MKFYNVIVNNRHVDLDVYLFSDKNIAVEKAKELAKEYCRHEEDYKESIWGVPQQGMLGYINYSCESDCVYIYEVILDVLIQ